MSVRLPIVLLGILLPAWIVAEANPPAPDQKPNILLIYTDDVGYGDLSIHGSKEITTPNIDALMESGVRCTEGTVCSSICAPSRAGLMTGRYPHRIGIHRNHMPLPASEHTLAELLHDGGYTTALFGKWHLGKQKGHRPVDHGFDVFDGFYGPGTSYMKTDGYYTDLLSEKAADFILEHRDEPYFLYLSYNATHTPMQAPRRYKERFSHIEDPGRRTYAAMLSALDDGVGRVMQAVKDSGQLENTLIFFINDNGGKNGIASSNRPLRGHKYGLYDGGIKVPFAVHWKGRLSSDTYNHPVSNLDVVPTCLAAAGITPPADVKLDGVNLLPYLSGKKQQPPHEALFWKAISAKAPRTPWMAVRSGNWKLHLFGDKSDKRPVELYNMNDDIDETNDLSGSRPSIVNKLRGLAKEWSREVNRGETPGDSQNNVIERYVFEVEKFDVEKGRFSPLTTGRENKAVTLQKGGEATTTVKLPEGSYNVTVWAVGKSPDEDAFNLTIGDENKQRLWTKVLNEPFPAKASLYTKKKSGTINISLEFAEPNVELDRVVFEKVEPDSTDNP